MKKRIAKKFEQKLCKAMWQRLTTNRITEREAMYCVSKFQNYFERWIVQSKKERFLDGRIMFNDDDYKPYYDVDEYPFADLYYISDRWGCPGRVTWILEEIKFFKANIEMFDNEYFNQVK